jgi:hypothetical protein
MQPTATQLSRRNTSHQIGYLTGGRIEFSVDNIEKERCLAASRCAHPVQVRSDTPQRPELVPERFGSLLTLPVRRRDDAHASRLKSRDPLSELTSPVLLGQCKANRSRHRFCCRRVIKWVCIVPHMSYGTQAIENGQDACACTHWPRFGTEDLKLGITQHLSQY